MSDQTITITGTIKAMREAKAITEKFSKREVIIETEGDYPQLLAIEFVNDKIELLGSVQVGERVTVNVDIRGRRWVKEQGAEPKYFLSLNGWRIDRVGMETQHPTRQADPRAHGQHQNLGAPMKGDDIPF